MLTMENDLKNISARLRFLLKIFGISQTELAKRINVKPQIIQYLCAGNTEKTKFMFDIADALNIDVSWLATGKGVMPTAIEPTPSDKTIPVLSLNQIKECKVLLHKIDLTKVRKLSIQSDISIDSFAVTLADQSMAPRFNLDTIIIIDPSLDIYQLPESNRFILVYLAVDDFLVFRQLQIINDIKTLVPMNTHLYKNTVLTEKDIILGACKEARWCA